MRKFRICLLCDSLSLGGAETHVVTLANRLAKDGHDVTLISGGGPLVNTLTEVKHILLPLNNKRKILSLLLHLHRLFKKGRFDVIHAHTRFSAFLCRPIVRARLVTTAHWIFDTRFPKGNLTTWGEQTLAVSNDIAEYLIKNYQLPPERISVTVNGIDTERFSPRPRENERIKIVYCSRLDRDRADVAFLLLEAITALSHQSFSLHVLGTGERFSELQERTNALLCREPRINIHLWGGVTDVAAHLSDADIVIGVSRAALEGMAAGAAVILAGNEGYLSIFHPHNATTAEKSNFCCRGAEPASRDALARDLSHLLSMPRERLIQMGKENRRYIMAHYGEARMVGDALKVYERICKRQVVLCGYYGFHNVGDDLLLRAYQEALPRKGYARVFVLSARRCSLRALCALRRGYDLILGGGNLLQDNTSARSLRFYLSMAARAHGRIEIHGGFGPLSCKGERACRPLLLKAHTLLCRTEEDLRIAQRLGAQSAHLSCDMALTLAFPPKIKGESILLAFKAPTEEEVPAALAFLLSLCRNFGKERCVLFVMHPDDAPFSHRAADLCGIPCLTGGTDEFLSALARTRMVVASRLHAGIAALGMGVPFALWEGEEKNRYFINDLRRLSDHSPYCTLFSFSDRIVQPLPPEGIKEAKAEALRRL